MTTYGKIECPKCGKETRKYGKRKGKQRFQCKVCGHLFDLRLNGEQSGSPAPPQPQPLMYKEPGDQPQEDYAEQIIRENSTETRPKKVEPYEPQRLRTNNEIISDGFGALLGNLIGDALNSVFEKKPKKKADSVLGFEQQEDLEVI
jgi:hypothetical protein